MCLTGIIIIVLALLKPYFFPPLLSFYQMLHRSNNTAKDRTADNPIIPIGRYLAWQVTAQPGADLGQATTHGNFTARLAVRSKEKNYICVFTKIEL
jgi:hypothetical protein